MKSVIAVVGITIASFLFVGCEPEPDTPGERIEEAGEEIGDAIEDATDQ